MFYNGIFFSNTGDKVTKDIVNSIGFPAKFPKDYMDFLENVNGGEPDKQNIKIHAQDYFNSTNIEFFLGITSAPERNLVAAQNWYQFYDGDYDKFMLPIASDIAGDKFFLKLSGRDRGKIYFDDHDYILRTNYCPNPIFVANSFDEFLGMLREPEVLPEES